jgi:hypothetical protein
MAALGHVQSSAFILALIVACGLLVLNRERFVQPISVYHPDWRRNQCKLVPSPAYPTDPRSVHEATCAAICKSQPGYTTYGAGDVVVTQGGVQCRCCDPASSARLLLDGTVMKPGNAATAKCRPGATFGIGVKPYNPASRTMFVSGDCEGVFVWQGKQMASCQKADPGMQRLCDYSGLQRHITDDQIAITDRYMTLAAKSDAWNAMAQNLPLDGDAMIRVDEALKAANAERQQRADVITQAILT